MGADGANPSWTECGSEVGGTVCSKSNAGLRIDSTPLNYFCLPVVAPYPVSIQNIPLTKDVMKEPY
eukprot:scaffold86752_cov48-Attheya_sp.AAC.4